MQINLKIKVFRGEILLTGLTDLYINSTGSFTSFSESKNTKTSNFMDLYDKLGSQIPSKFEAKGD